MADPKQLEILKQGVDVWNKWLFEHSEVVIDLDGANLAGANLQGAFLKGAYLWGANLEEANLKGAFLLSASLEDVNLKAANLREADLGQTDLFKADLQGADLQGASLFEAGLREANLDGANLAGASLQGAILIGANLQGANLQGANLERANLWGADLCKANLQRSNLYGSNLHGSNLTEANLTGVDLRHSNIVQATISRAKISGSKVYGISVWDLEGEFQEQKELIITPDEESIITVDNIKIAQFIYLLLNNKEIRDVINSLTSKTVLILGRFALPKRKAILDALRNKLREYDLLPIVFDFERPTNKDFTETIKTLAGISYFVIADITNPKSSPLELQATVPDYQIPFVPIIQKGEMPFAMMADLQKKYNWVLETRSYDSLETLIDGLKEEIIDPAIEMRNELRMIKAREPIIISLEKSKRGKL